MTTQAPRLLHARCDALLDGATVKHGLEGIECGEQHKRVVHELVQEDLLEDIRLATAIGKLLAQPGT